MAKNKTAPISLQEKIKQGREAMKAALIERDEEVDLILTALICQENPLLVGAPGTAKSLLLDSLVRWMGKESSFSILFNKFTTPEEVFGPISVSGLKQDRYSRITTGKLPEADIAFADEIFKASSAILNTMLRILNERKWENGDGRFVKVPLKICVAASNEWPGDGDSGKELCALLDRFLLRKKVKTVSINGRKQLLRRAVDNNNCTPKFASILTPEDVDTAHEEAMLLPWTAYAQIGLWECIEALNKEGIFPGDRRMYKSVKAVRAFAYLCGAKEVERVHLEILSHVLWDDPAEQPEKTAQIVSRIANPTGALINEKLLQAEDVLAKSPAVEAAPKLQTLQKDIGSLPNDPRKQPALDYLAQAIKDCYNKVIGRETE